MTMARDEGSQIVGFRLDQELARKVKAEAGRRGIRLNTLFEELWAGYEKQPKPAPKA
jgi:predicted HicB family RNase H-like nuclease